jgi:hypothetical protein
MDGLLSGLAPATGAGDAIDGNGADRDDPADPAAA